jgi:hypothetical protein
MLESIRGRAAAFRAGLWDAALTQESLLVDLLRRHSGCEYGRRHGFDSIASAAQFAERVPIARYEDLRAGIERMADGEPDVMLSGPVRAFEETGGSSGGHKLIPCTDRSLDAFRRGISVWLDDLYFADAALARGSAYWSISPAGRAPRRTAGGIPIGLENDLLYLGETVAAEIAATLCVPPHVAGICEFDRWRLTTCVYLASDARLALISVWSPTFLLQLLEFMVARSQVIAADIERGFDGRAPDPVRAAQVAHHLSGETPDFGALWPALRLVSAWTHGTSARFATQLAGLLPHAAMQGKGLLATECLVSIPLRDLEWPVLAVESAYVELLDSSGRARPASDAEAGAEYELLVTNDSGLYRYAIGDRVRVHGFAGRAPLLEFLGRTGVNTDLVGEKLTEEFVARILASLAVEFAVLAPDREGEDGNAGYALLLDARLVTQPAAEVLAQRCDLELRANPQYAYARDLNQLAPLRAVRCADPLGGFLAARLRAGQKLGDIKPPALIIDRAWPDMFTAVGSP